MDFVISVFGSIFSFYALLGIFVLQPVCYAQYKNSGHEPKWDFWAGCMLKMPDGRYLPEDLVTKCEIGNTINLRDKR